MKRTKKQNSEKSELYAKKVNYVDLEKALNTLSRWSIKMQGTSTSNRYTDYSSTTTVTSGRPMNGLYYTPTSTTTLTLEDLPW